MFSKGKTMARGTESGMENAINRIVEGTRFNGEIVCDSNIRIDGSFIGDMETKGRIVIGPQGSVEGNVRCQNCEVEGRIKGRLAVEELLSLKGASQVEGEVYYGQIAIEPGAKLSGTLHLGGKVKDIKASERKEQREAAEQTA
jgi:cytoskeletal protein CcmA (bactofilin family)